MAAITAPVANVWRPTSARAEKKKDTETSNFRDGPFIQRSPPVEFWGES